VNRPGVYALDEHNFGEYVSLREALYLGGWLRWDADPRTILLRRRDGTEQLLDATTDAMFKSLPKLPIQDGDEITVRSAANTILVTGYVIRQGQQPLPPSRTVREVLQQPGFLLPLVQTVFVERRGTPTIVVDVHRMRQDARYQKKLVLQSGDHIQVVAPDFKQSSRFYSRNKSVQKPRLEPKPKYIWQLMGLPLSDEWCLTR
jgi:hypothetical protein